MSENSNDGDEQSEHAAQTVGQILKAKREEKSMSLEDVAGKTRITTRHLEALEASQYRKLPGKTYVIGFSKAYARCVELDEADIAAKVREELAGIDQLNTHSFAEVHEPASANRIPPKALAWTTAIIGFIALAALLIWSNAQLNRDNDSAIADEDIAEEIVSEENEASPPASEEVITAGKVIMTATEEVWLEIYDADRKTIYENVLQAGDSYEIPADANGPMIVTGRPDALKFTVGGKAIKPLGDGKSTIKDVGVSAQALIDFNKSSNQAE